MPDFTEKQLEVINLNNCNILVSAAAGAGKTSVLVGRIMRKLCDLTNPVDIDEILVLTFTKAAAGEMRERIARAISDKVVELQDRQAQFGDIKESVDNEKTSINNEELRLLEHLKRQSLLIYNAQITTIDSFCLNILKNNFTEIGLEPGFRPANEAEMIFLKDEVLKNTLEQVLSEHDIEYLDEFLGRFAGKDNTRKIEEVIMSLYDEAEKEPFVEDYFLKHKDDYAVKSEESLYAKSWFNALYNKITHDIAEAKRLALELLDYCDEFGPAEYREYVLSDIDILSSLAESTDYNMLQNRINAGISWPALRKKTACDEDTKEAFKNKRKLYKDLINDIQKSYMEAPIDVVISRMNQNARVISALLDITYKYYCNLEEEKRDKGIITFSDMEHLALKVLLKKDGDEYVPTNTALDYRKCFKELMIDEYQDSNFIQEALIHSISGEDEGIYDRFMVGDVKQSIYRFRNANPELFMDKYDKYDSVSGNCRKIDLSENFRSEKTVLDAVNVVFERIMDKEIGGVTYDESSKLYYGNRIHEQNKSEFIDTSDDITEFLAVKADGTTDIKTEELEATLIANRIKDLVSHYSIIENKDGVESARPCDYRDIVILTRSGGSFTDTLKNIMDDNGIPVHVASKSGYFTSYEIVTLLNLLSVINNPYNDIQMYGTLTSVLGEFTEDEMALLSVIFKTNIYDSLKEAAQMDIPNVLSSNDGINEDDLVLLKNKSIRFLERLNKYRDLVPYTSINDLLRIIINETGYVDYMAALPMGEQKKANILMLLSKAAGYEEDGFKGLFSFNRYIEKLKKYETDEGEVMTLDENANVVRIMTMHKSKGLEFPVCILANLSKGFNRADERSELIFHNAYGIGMNYVDVKKRAKYADLRKKFIASMIHKDSLSEEMRVFYVAMTRAKKKLIMTAVLDDDWQIDNIGGDFKMPPVSVRMHIKNYVDMLRLSCGDDEWNGKIALKIVSYNELVGDNIAESIDRENLLSKLRGYINGDKNLCDYSEEALDVKDKLVDSLRIRLGFEYSHKNLEELYTKTSVSELKMAAIDEALLKGSMEEIPKEFFEAHDETGYVPAFADGETKKASGVARGSAYHRVMELVDYRGIVDKKVTEAMLDDMLASAIGEKKLLQDDYDLVDRAKVCAFLNSKLGKRMSDAALKDDLYLEQPFVLGVNADRLNKSFPEDELVLIQGIIDVFFIEDGQIVLLDYKTDKVAKEEELVNRYRAQLDYYSEALSRIMEMPVKERLIYSFSLEKMISL